MKHTARRTLELLGATVAPTTSSSASATAPPACLDRVPEGANRPRLNETIADKARAGPVEANTEARGREAGRVVLLDHEAARSGFLDDFDAVSAWVDGFARRAVAIAASSPALACVAHVTAREHF